MLMRQETLTDLRRYLFVIANVIFSFVDMWQMSVPLTLTLSESNQNAN